MNRSTSTNPFVEVYQRWVDLLQWHGRSVFLGRASNSPKAFIAIEGDEPVLGLGLTGEVFIWSDGGFQIRYYDGDFRRVLPFIPLRTDHAVRKRVLMYDHDEHLDPHTHDHERMLPYLGWRSIPVDARLCLVPDPHVDWRIAIHPNSPHRGWYERLLDEQYDIATARYWRAVRRHERERGINTPEQEREIVKRNAEKIKAITLALDPYTPAKRPTEATRPQGGPA